MYIKIYTSHLYTEVCSENNCKKENEKIKVELLYKFFNKIMITDVMIKNVMIMIKKL